MWHECRVCTNFFFVPSMPWLFDQQRQRKICRIRYGHLAKPIYRNSVCVCVSATFVRIRVHGCEKSVDGIRTLCSSSHAHTHKMYEKSNVNDELGKLNYNLSHDLFDL